MQKTTERVSTSPSVALATYATLAVHAEPGSAASQRLEVAGRIARQLDAHLIGVGAETFDPALFTFGGFTDATMVATVQEQIAKNIEAAETAFRRDAGDADISWRSMLDYPDRALVKTAHGVDLIIMSPRSNRGVLNSADPADVVMSAGRPVLIVPEGRTHLHGDCVVVAWKDTRECRRAVSDALPFLQRAEDVIVLSVEASKPQEGEDDGVADVAANLKRHGVKARPLAVPTSEDTVAAEVTRIAALFNADLIVAGAYGHSRLREWALGGVTNDLLHRPSAFVLLSH